MACEPLVQGPLFGAPVSRLAFDQREFVKTPTPSPESSPEKEEANRVDLDLAALDIHGEPSKTVEKARAGDKAKNLLPASDWKTAAMAELDKCWVVAASSRHKSVREAAARHYAEEKAAAGKKRTMSKKRLSQESVDLVLAKAKLPRPVLRVDHELIDSLTTFTPERREEMRAAKTMAMVNLQAHRNWEDELVRRYHTYGYIEIEVDEEEEEDSDDDNIWDWQVNN